MKNIRAFNPCTIWGSGCTTPPPQFEWNFDEFMLKNYQNLEIPMSNIKQLYEKTLPLNLSILLKKSSVTQLFNFLINYKMPLYYISTRDSFAYDLIEKISYLERDGRKYKKIKYYFDMNNLPFNFKSFIKEFPDGFTGCTAYHDFFTHEEMLDIEKETFETEQKCLKKHFLPMTS